VALAEQKYGKQDRRPVLIHGQFTREDQVDRIVELGIFPSLFPLHTYYWGDWHREQTIGEPRVNNISPTKWFENRQARFTSHHDAPVAPPNNFRVLWATVNRLSRTGKIIGADQRVSVETGLKALTLWSAYQHFEENEKGSLEIGKQADMIILSENPLTIDPMDLTDIYVLQTIKEGKTIYQANN
ncbi:MAG: amidohydrolase family protein, partial [Brevinema sp.]